ncbi:TetR/AcrR family transcriptional regulator [Paractinoplanes durhamensis]|uniref:TetR/AcrR family transcriptional regulator n=1 Tax=Paractinoplanes durhamensis TaxID=113563 RepID=UPI001EF189E5|nr:helix-turn-helix domain-containing protein [Actinoplanes durhamensis]
MTSLRERKKQATRVALQEAALRLALAKGPDNVRVDEIADAAGVSPRTYNNYFPSREHAIVAAVTASRMPALAAGGPLAAAVADAVVGHYTEPGDPAAMLMITTNPGLRACYVDTAAGIEGPLTEAIVSRGVDAKTAEVLAAAIGAAAKVALRRWLKPAGGLMMVSGSLPELIRAALEPLAPALDATAG